MGNKHRTPSRWERLTRRRPRLALRSPAPIELLDLRTGLTHLLTPAAAAAGRVRAGRYLALCGAQVIPAATTESGQDGRVAGGNLTPRLSQIRT
ncbi:MAG: hypothetical protein ACRDTA_30730 [Pseudonocardiaceae bacterium]